MSSTVTVLFSPTRLAVAGSIALTTRSTNEIAVVTGLDRADVLTALGELLSAGIVQPEGGGWEISADGLRSLAARFAEVDRPMDPSIGFGMTDDERVVLDRYFSGRVLHEIPPNPSDPIGRPRTTRT